jgi:IS605 OrfB family transposase
LINGRILKSINQWFHKHKSKMTSTKRYHRIENYFHHVSRYVIKQCLQYGIGKIIIGKNDGWKQNINLGGQTNQQFCSIPFDRLIEKIKYKADLMGIDVIFTEESYTSQASYLDRDDLPVWSKDRVKPIFSGKRIRRGLYRSKNGTLLNADINGSANIGRKIIQNEEILLRLDRSLAARPVVINPLKACHV